MVESRDHGMKISHGLLAVLLAGVLTGCEFPGMPNPAERPVPADKVVEFAPLFKDHCSGCHGANGTLGPAPPLNDAIFLSIVPDAELLRVIGEGRPGTPMPAFAREHGGTLNAAQVSALAKGLKSHWLAQVSVSAPLPSYVDDEPNASARSSENTERGKQAFARACAACHGEFGQGTSKAGAVHDPVFLGLISNQALRRIIITGRPDLGMPNFVDHKARGPDYQPLSSSEIDDLVALLADWRNSPAAAVPLGTSEPVGKLSTDSGGPKP